MAIAWATHILRNQCANQDIPRYDQMILAHKCRSLKYLHEMVPQCTGVRAVSLTKTKAERDALLLLVMFHCLLEVASGSIREWTYHMRGALLIIKFYTNPELKVFSHEVLEHIYSYFLERGTFLGTTMTASTGNKEEERYLDSLEWSTGVPAIFAFPTGQSICKNKSLHRISYPASSSTSFPQSATKLGSDAVTATVTITVTKAPSSGYIPGIYSPP